METPVLVVAGWTCGLNAYLTILMLGIGGRLGWIDAPGSVTSAWSLAIAAIAFSLEFVADKIPLFDSVWDAIHTVIRPAVAIALGITAAGVTETTISRPSGAVLAGGLALVAHLSKSSTRLALNVSPEPITNLAASITEDTVVFALLGLAMARPRVAALIALVLMVMFAIAAIALFSLARRGFRYLSSQVVNSRLPQSG